MPEVEVTKDSWFEAVEIVREKTGNPDYPIWAVFVHHYPLCIGSMVSDFTWLAFTLHRKLGGFRNESVESYWRLPAILVDAFDEIDAEIQRIEAIRRARKRGLTDGSKQARTSGRR
jgi:hypothetical protein